MRSAANPLSMRESRRDCSFTIADPIIANKELVLRLAYTTGKMGFPRL
jgi:hypothetical protein